MTIDNSLLKQALELQKQVGREPWMDDIQTIRAMRSKKVEWGIIYTVISQKHKIDMPQEIFERQANKLLKSLPGSSKKKRPNLALEKINGIQGTTEVTSEGTTQVTPQGTDQDTFQVLEKLNPIA